MTVQASDYAYFIRQLVKAEGITGINLANRAGLTKGRISQLLSPIATGARDVEQQYARLASALNYPPVAMSAAVAAKKPDLAFSATWKYAAPVLAGWFASRGTASYSDAAIQAAAIKMVDMFTQQSDAVSDPSEWPICFAEEVADEMHSVAKAFNQESGRH